MPDSRDTSCESYGKGESDVMPSYLERYRQGECEQVWAELLALSSQIRDHDLHAEAIWRTYRGRGCLGTGRFYPGCDGLS